MSLLLLFSGGGGGAPAAPVGGGEPLAFLPVKYATAVTVPFSMIKRGVVDLAVSADWTPATGDAKISIDQGADANTASLPAATASATGKWGQALTTGETTGKLIVVTYIDSATKAVEDNALYLFTYGHASAYWPFDLSTAMSGQAVASVTGNVGGNLTGNVGGNVTGTVGSVVGAVGSVTGAVGSVTGNVGGNVTGTVGGFVNPPGLKKNTAWPNFSFAMYDSTTGALKPGLATVNAQRRIDNAAVATCTNSVTEVSAGIYTIDLSAADLNGDAITLLFTATNASAREFQIVTEP